MDFNFDYKAYLQGYGCYSQRVIKDGRQVGFYTVQTPGNELIVSFREYDTEDPSWRAKRPTVVKQKIGIAVPLLSASLEREVDRATALLIEELSIGAPNE